ncbi:MAG TPA: YhjD/YihY/BrkB family envelope integrity protein [Nitrospirota bacterium]|nr:YhjD/YihY/BrkB family envelope integrity protein [Nitrospirota bacterium]
MSTASTEFFSKLRAALSETFSAFQRNNDLTAASSLAFSATLALIPSLFLLTFVLGAIIGSSADALARTQELLRQLIPAYSQDIVREVRSISSHLGAIGLVNSLVLLWSITPLVADLRISLGTVFRKKPTRPFLLEKLFDVALGIVFLMGVSAIAVAGIVITLLETRTNLHLPLGWFERVVPFLFMVAVVFALYALFSKGVNKLNLLIGAVTTSLLWFAMRPLFHLFLLYNPGYGFAFGSFKSLFVVIIWIYFSLVVFLLGAEIAASLGRDETVFIKKLMEGKKGVPARIISKYVLSREEGSVIFSEGESAPEMFSVLKGRVSLRKGGMEIAVITEGKCFGGMSFLLSSSRMVEAVALEDVDLVSIDNENINKLMNEYPAYIIEILREMAERMRDSNKVID